MDILLLSQDETHPFYAGVNAYFSAPVLEAVGPRELLTAVCQRAPEPKRLVWIAGADHFFQGTEESPGAKLNRMQAEMRLWLRETFALVGTANQPDLRI